MYIEQHMRAQDIANIFGVSAYTILSRLREENIAIRSKGFGFNVQSPIKMSGEQYQFFDGLLLGDGSIVRRKNTERFRNDFLSCAFKHKEFAQYIKDKLQLKPNVNKKVHYSDRYKGGSCVQYGILSSNNTLYTEERDRWYPNGKKVIPEDFRFTPISMNIFYIGDGYVKKQVYKNTIHFCTQSFTKDNLQILVDHFDNIGIKVSVQKNNELRLSSYHAQDFLDYIGDCPVDCYRYKWNLV